jgi:PAS domain S-box-containing protein
MIGDERPAEILVVDDSMESVNVLVSMLGKRGYKVRPATSGELALRTAQSSAPDLILLDIMMPDLDGYQVCEALKLDDRCRDIPVIFLSGLDETMDKVKAFAVGGVDYITKPFQVKEVLARVETHLALRNMRIRLEKQNNRLEQEIADRMSAEKALRDSEELHRLILSSMSDTTFITDDEGAFTYVCPNVHTIFGYTVDEVFEIGNVSPLLGSGLVDRDLLEKYKEIRNVEIQIRDKGGEEHVLLVTIKRVSIKRGTALYACRDITERKHVEDALQKAHQKLAGEQKRFHAFMNNSPVLAFMKDEQGRIAYVNELWEHTFNLSCDDVRGKATEEVWPGETGLQFRKGDVEVLELGRTAESVETIPGSEGDLSHWWTFKFPIEDSDGHRYLGGVALNVTERTRAREALEKAKEEWERTFDTIPDFIAVLGRDQRIVRCNKAMVDGLGLDSQRIIGTYCLDLFYGPGKPVKSCPHLPPARIRNPHTEEVHSDRLGKDFLITTAPFSDADGNPSGCVHVARDISQLKRKEEELQETIKEKEHLVAEIQQQRQLLEEANIRLQEIDELKSIFLATMSHEIRTPLNAIVGFADLALESEELDQVRQYLTNVRRASRTLMTLINDILDFSKIESDKLDLEYTEFTADELIDRLCDLFSTGFVKAGIELNLVVSPIVSRIENRG